MKFTRNQRIQQSFSLTQRVHIFIIGTALTLVLVLIHLQIDKYGSAYVTVAVEKRASALDSRGARFQGFDLNRQRTQDTPATATFRRSLLNSPDTIKNLPSCQATRYGTAAIQFNSSELAIFTGWDVAAITKWDRSAFQFRFANYMQYIKGRDVQPLKDKDGNQCKVSTQTLIETMSILGTRKGDMDLLFFTNDKENPDFIRDLSKDYSMPNAVAQMDTFSGGFKVFSAMEQGSSHPFHFHDAAWLGQVSGSRLWLFLPPDTPRKIVGKKVNGCDYLFGRSPIPKGASACVQTKSEVMYLPSGWLHATCALEPWSVGIGGQGGDPAIYHQKFEQLDMQYKIDSNESQKMAQCGIEI